MFKHTYVLVFERVLVHIEGALVVVLLEVHPLGLLARLELAQPPVQTFESLKRTQGKR
jgi:hypothetical protein